MPDIFFKALLNLPSWVLCLGVLYVLNIRLKPLLEFSKSIKGEFEALQKQVTVVESKLWGESLLTNCMLCTVHKEVADHEKNCPARNKQIK